LEEARSIKEWLAYLDMDQWASMNLAEKWRCSTTGIHVRWRKGLSSVVILTASDSWNERNARVNGV
jgi:hypothetical protein